MTYSLFLICSLVFGDAVDRLEIPKLKALHEAIAATGKLRRPVEVKSAWQDFRASMHVHSKFSHDSRAPIEEVVRGAKLAGVRILMFNEHPAKTYDYYRDGHRGMRDGVLMIPGAETGGFLAYPRQSIQDEKTNSKQDFALLVRRADGMVFLSHLEERMDWKIDGLTGTEIYNTHADVKDEKRLYGLLRSPTGLLRLSGAYKAYPQEAFGALLDYPADYLRRYDELCQTARHTGVCANDAHHNQGVVARLIEGDKIQIVDALGVKQSEIALSKQPLLRTLALGKKPGDVVFEMQLDPYERSLGHVSTHLLMKELTEADVWAAVKGGRAYVAFDWLGDPTGFVAQVVDEKSNSRHKLGAEIAFQNGLQLEAHSPLPCRFRLIRDGKEAAVAKGYDFKQSLTQPGIYRVEAWLELAGESKPWILTNPFYVRKSN